MIYLDNMAYHPVLPEVISKTTELMYKLANPSSLHATGTAMKIEIEDARNVVAGAIGCKPNEIVFTSGATEGNQTMLLNYPGKISNFEHSSISEMSKWVTDIVTHKQIDEEFALNCAHILVDNETGTNFTNYIYKNYIPLSDITAAIGNIPVNVKDLKLEMASFSGEKIGAFSGSGVLYVSDKTDFIPLIEGHQERGYRGGTENILGIVAIRVAIEQAISNMQLKNQHCAKLKTVLIRELKRHKFDFIINGKNQIPAICSVSFKSIDGAALANYLDIHNICVSTGSACNSSSMEPSKVLRAFGVPNEYINGTIRFSFGLQNTVNEIKYTVNKIAEFMETIV